jgi:hypothetical protein
VPEIRIYVADDHGLLPVDQVERNVLHEIGHALGMRGHSPIPADLMYEVARDRRVDRLSVEDVNSFRALYRLPNGTIYARLPRGGDLPRAAAQAPAGPPQLAPQPYEDKRLGFAVQPGLGWRLVPTPRGVVAVDGVAWTTRRRSRCGAQLSDDREYLARHAPMCARARSCNRVSSTCAAGAPLMRSCPRGRDAEDHASSRRATAGRDRDHGSADVAAAGLRPVVRRDVLGSKSAHWAPPPGANP